MSEQEKNETESIFHIGGSIEKAEKGEYNLDIKAILSEAWQTTQQSRLALNMAFLFCVFVGMLVSILLIQYLGDVETVLADEKSTLLINIVATIVISPFLGGVEMIGVYQSVKLKTHGRLVFAFLGRGSLVAICALIASSLTTIGFQLLLIPGIYLMVALSLTSPLIIEKRLSPIQAIILSVKATRFQWFKIFGLYLALGLLLLLLIIPVNLFSQGAFPLLGSIVFIFGFSYIMPMFYNVKGILYREIFGLTLHAINGENVSTTFSA